MNDETIPSDISINLADTMYREIEKMHDDPDCGYSEIVKFIALKLDESWAEGRNAGLLSGRISEMKRE